MVMISAEDIKGIFLFQWNFYSISLHVGNSWTDDIYFYISFFGWKHLWVWFSGNKQVFQPPLKKINRHPWSNVK